MAEIEFGYLVRDPNLPAEVWELGQPTVRRIKALQSEHPNSYQAYSQFTADRLLDYELLFESPGLTADDRVQVKSSMDGLRAMLVILCNSAEKALAGARERRSFRLLKEQSQPADSPETHDG